MLQTQKKFCEYLDNIKKELGKASSSGLFEEGECVKTPNTIADRADYLLDVNDQDKVVVNPQVSALMSRGPLNVFETPQ